MSLNDATKRALDVLLDGMLEAGTGVVPGGPDTLTLRRLGEKRYLAVRAIGACNLTYARRGASASEALLALSEAIALDRAHAEQEADLEATLEASVAIACAR